MDKFKARMTRYMYLILICFTFLSCNGNGEVECDYTGISKSLLKKVWLNDEISAKEMTAIKDGGFWRKESVWGTIQRDVAGIFSSEAEIEGLKGSLVINKKAKESYAVVTILLRQDGTVKDFFEVRFSSPESPYGCKVQSFDFIRTGLPPMIFKKPDFDTGMGRSR